MSRATESAFVALTCATGAGRFAGYPDVEVMQRIDAVISRWGAVVGVADRGGLATIRVTADKADALLAAVAALPGVLCAKLINDESGGGHFAGGGGRLSGQP